MEGTGEKLDSINRTLEKHNEIAQKMLDVMQKPENKIVQAFILGGLVVSALGIVNIIDTILSWLAGG